MAHWECSAAGGEAPLPVTIWPPSAKVRGGGGRDDAADAGVGVVLVDVTLRLVGVEADDPAADVHQGGDPGGGAVAAGELAADPQEGGEVGLVSAEALGDREPVAARRRGGPRCSPPRRAGSARSARRSCAAAARGRRRGPRAPRSDSLGVGDGGRVRRSWSWRYSLMNGCRRFGAAGSGTPCVVSGRSARALPVQEK